MTQEEAQATVNHYRSTRAKPDSAEYMTYMRARGVLSDAKVETLTAGQRGFLAAVRRNLSSEVAA